MSQFQLAVVFGQSCDYAFISKRDSIRNNKAKINLPPPICKALYLHLTLYMNLNAFSRNWAPDSPEKIKNQKAPKCFI